MHMHDGIHNECTAFFPIVPQRLYSALCSDENRIFGPVDSQNLTTLTAVSRSKRPKTGRPSCTCKASRLLIYWTMHSLTAITSLLSDVERLFLSGFTSQHKFFRVRQSTYKKRSTIQENLESQREIVTATLIFKNVLIYHSSGKHHTRKQYVNYRWGYGFVLWFSSPPSF